MAFIDNHELAQLAADLQRAPGRIERDAKGILKRGALEVKRGMIKEFSGHSYAPSVNRSLEMQQIDSLTWDVGELDSSGPQWGIAAILAYGTSNNAPVVDHEAPARREAFVIERYLGDAGEDDVLGGPR
jgi:hypothetical protein